MYIDRNRWMNVGFKRMDGRRFGWKRSEQQNQWLEIPVSMENESSLGIHDRSRDVVSLDKHAYGFSRTVGRRECKALERGRCRIHDVQAQPFFQPRWMVVERRSYTRPSTYRKVWTCYENFVRTCSKRLAQGCDDRTLGGRTWTRAQKPYGSTFGCTMCLR